MNATPITTLIARLQAAGDIEAARTLEDLLLGIEHNGCEIAYATDGTGPWVLNVSAKAAADEASRLRDNARRWTFIESRLTMAALREMGLDKSAGTSYRDKVDSAIAAESA